MAWRGWDNAEIYDRFVREHRIYRRLNLKLIELADLGDASRVLDLGCGTGATALACLRVLDTDAELLGVDASPEMVEVARANVLDPRARFEVGAAAAVDAVAGGATFDRVVCNAAFWQFPSQAPVLAGLARVLEPGAICAFNVPVERLAGERPPVHAFQVALARAIEARTSRPFAGHATALDPEALDRVGAEHGFVAERRERFDYEGTQHELVELMRIPAMIGPLAPELDAEASDRLVDLAAERVADDDRVVVPWVYFVYRFDPAC